jgi:three-Cys-motif partner protein
MIQQFGGKWTEEKLGRLRKYLAAYMRIFSTNERAKHLRTTYLDAFAGSGERSEEREGADDTAPLFVDWEAAEAAEFFKGSAEIALETQPPFDNYIFVERDPAYAAALDKLRNRFTHLSERVQIVAADANAFLISWCNSTDWRRNRAVVFLDPYGMQVDWSTIETIARTQAIDLWILYPLGQAVNRLLKRQGPPTGGWADRLTRSFGSDEWKERFYKPSAQGRLFGGQPTVQREADLEALGKYFLERLGIVFNAVASNALELRNSRGNPLFLLCFAAGNPQGSKTAVKIANDILKKK